MANQVVLPATNQVASGFLPQPVSQPFSSGNPAEGPQSALLFLNIPAGQTTGSLNITLSQIGMSMVQSMLVDNEANEVAITVKGGSIGVSFGIQPSGTQIIPIFQKGTSFAINVTLAQVQLVPVSLAFQVFNTFVPPASWVSNLSVSGNVNINDVTGGVNVTVQNAELIGVGIAAEITGGASSTLLTGLTATAKQIKMASGTGTFKGFDVLSTVAGWLQLFDTPAPGSVILGTTPPNWSYPILANTVANPQLPPEGLAFLTGLQAAFTTTINGNTAPAANLLGNIYYA